MTVTSPARRWPSDTPNSENTPEVNVDMIEYGLPFDPAPAIDLAIAVDIGVMPMGPFPPQPPPPPPGAAPMAVVLPELDPPLEAANDIVDMVLPEPIAEVQETVHYHYLQQHQQDHPRPLILQQPHPTSLPSSAVEGGRVAVDSTITNSAVLVAATTALHRRSSRKAKPPPFCTSCGLPNSLILKMTAYRQQDTVHHRPPSQEGLVPSIMSYAMPAVDVAQVPANVAIVPLPLPLPVNPLPAPAPVQAPVELPIVHPGIDDVIAPPNDPQQQAPLPDEEDQ
ncbi:hypothetical protein BG015_008324 [Linnemannia schmuckeri]|uniref:Uncharacterized protein n=1 Tax=Linnemannia schmuckeri TaxID=64567 RepID=A0A9P5VEU6_9FUNG|nr:hypothetical protein BG015_008324 [Linnemannia schmuckeri]